MPAWQRCLRSSGQWPQLGGSAVVHQPSSEDWFELLGIADVVRDVFAGATTITSALGDLAGARTSWHGTADDWVAVVDGVTVQVALLKVAAQEQREAMLALEESLQEAAGPEPSWIPPDVPLPDDRLLTADELALLNSVPDWFGELEAAHERRAEDAEGDAEEAEADFADAQADLEEALADQVRDPASEPDPDEMGDDW